MQGNLPSQAVPTIFSRLRSLRLDYGWIVIIVLPLLILVLNDKWIYTPVGFIDAWMYHGYFNQLPDLLRVAPDIYFGSRLPWNISGFIMYQLFPPFTANFILHLGHYYVALGSFYLMSKLLFDNKVALFTTIGMGCYSYFLFSMGWDYIDGPVLTYLLLTFWLLTLATKSSYWQLCLMGAGASYSSTVSTNIFVLNVLPFLIVFYLFYNRLYRKNNLTVSFISFSFGFIATIVMFGLLNYSINQNFWFLIPSIKHTFFVIPSGRSIEPFGWLLQGPWISLPLALSFISVISIVVKRLSMSQRILIILFLLNFGMHIILNIVSPTVRFSYYATYMLPFIFLCIAALLSIHLHIDTNQQFLTLSIVVCIIMLSSFVFAKWINQHFYLPNILSIMPSLLFSLFTFTVLIRPPKYNQMMVIFFIGFTLANSLFYADLPLPYTDRGTSTNFGAIIDGFDAMDAIAPPSQLYVWYQLEEPLGKLFASLASPQLALYAGGIPMVSDNFPSLASHRMGLKHLVTGKRIAILTIDSNALEKANATLEQAGYKPKFLSRKSVVRGDIRYEIIFIELAV